jgi:hypothetical protein
VVRVTLGSTTLATFPSGTADISGSFAAPVPGSYTVVAAGTSTAANCVVRDGLDVIPGTVDPEVPGEPETGPGEPEATTPEVPSEAPAAPVSSTPLPVTG